MKRKFEGTYIGGVFVLPNFRQSDTLYKSSLGWHYEAYRSVCLLLFPLTREKMRRNGVWYMPLIENWKEICGFLS